MKGTITKEEAQKMMQNWTQYFIDNPGIKSVPFFKTEKGEKILGCKIPIGDYVQLVSKMIVDQFAVYFGLDDNKQLRLIVWASGHSAREVESYYITNGYVLETEMVKPKESSLKNAMPPFLISQWLKFWNDSFSNELDIPVELCRIQEETLRGYNFESVDFYNVLMAGNGVDFNEVFFCFANHKTGTEASEGCIGVNVVASFSTSGNNKLLDDGGNAFFNRSAPCPPTCQSGVI